MEKTYHKRKADADLVQWKADSDRKPLIVKGARQVGKTETIKNFARNSYGNFMVINFIEDPAYEQIVSQGYSAASIIREISLISPEMKFVPGQTLIVFDEIQAFPEIATSLKFFKEDGRFDVICSGSLLGVQYKRISSHSVGYKSETEMRSMDFEEFLWAVGYGDDIADNLFADMAGLRPLSPSAMERFSNLFLSYIVLGGMPDVVRDFVKRGTYENTLNLQNEIVNDYRDDVRKYCEGLDASRIMAVFDNIAPQLAKENKKFQYSKIIDGGRSRDYAGCIDWLNDAGVVNLCHCLNFPELPLKGNYTPDKFKLYFADTGLLIAMMEKEAQNDIRRNKNLGVYKGALYENIVAEALVKCGLPLYYFKRDDSKLEQDFFVRTQNVIMPVEVKASNNKAKSMQTLIASDKYRDIKSGIKLAMANIGQANCITTFPYFLTFLLNRYLRHLEQQ